MDNLKNKTNAAENFFGFPQIDSDLTVWFVFDGKAYELSQFNISFGQAVDHKGQPQDEVRGGRLLLTLTEAVPNNIYKWAMTSTTKDGVVEFRSKTSNSPLRIEFVNGYCINFERLIGEGVGLNTSLVISPQEVVINGANLYNHWV